MKVSLTPEFLGFRSRVDDVSVLVVCDAVTDISSFILADFTAIETMHEKYTVVSR
jgi:hypothetical protein